MIEDIEWRSMHADTEGSGGNGAGGKRQVELMKPRQDTIPKVERRAATLWNMEDDKDGLFTNVA